MSTGTSVAVPKKVVYKFVTKKFQKDLDFFFAMV